MNIESQTCNWKIELNNDKKEKRLGYIGGVELSMVIDILTLTYTVDSSLIYQVIFFVTMLYLSSQIDFQ